MLLAAVFMTAASGCFLFERSEPKEPPAPVEYTFTYGQDKDYLVGVAAIALKSTVEITATVSGKSYAGTGVIIGVKPGNAASAYTYIITNNHVVSGENLNAQNADVQVAMPGDYDKSGKLIWKKATVLAKTNNDVSSDLAIIRIPYVKAHFEGDSPAYMPCVYSDAELKYGQHILAAGNALNYGTSVCDGIVSNPSLGISTTKFKGTVIMVSAPINSGNSGGGVWDMEARLVGINTFKAVTDAPGDDSESKSSVYADGMGFALKMSQVKKYVDDYNAANPSNFITMKAAG